MAFKFVLCRRKDDYSVTTEIAEVALPQWPDWEPVPAKTDEAQPISSPEGGAEGSASEPSPAPEGDPQTARKSRTRAASTDKE